MSYRHEPYPVTDYIIDALLTMPETRGKLVADIYISSLIAAMVFLGEVPGEWGVFGIVAVQTGLSAYLLYVGKALKQAESKQSNMTDFENE